MSRERRWCERCGQGWVEWVRLSQTGEEFWLCDECEGVWWDQPSDVPESNLPDLLLDREIAITDARLEPCS